MQDFQLHLTDEEKAFCKALIHYVIANHLGLPAERPQLQSATLQAELGAFVTLKIDGHLRGCIGNIVGRGPLVDTIERMAGAAAFEDPRFPPLTTEEYARIEVEVSVMGPVTPCPDTNLIEIGRHGLVVRKTMHSGLLLPQVATEWDWDRETFLDQTCVKAGLPKGSWRKSKTEIFWFEAVIF